MKRILTCNQFRKLTDIKEYEGNSDLLRFCISAEMFYFRDDYDFNGVCIAVDRGWLTSLIKEESERMGDADRSDPIYFLENCYMSEDSIDWFFHACNCNKVAMVEVY